MNAKHARVNLIKKQETVSLYSDNLTTLITYNTRNLCEFSDPDYGIFFRQWQYAIRKKNFKHPKRNPLVKQIAHNKLTKEKAQKILERKNLEFDIISWTSRNEKSLFFDRNKKKEIEISFNSLIGRKPINLHVSKKEISLRIKKAWEQKSSDEIKNIKEKTKKTNLEKYGVEHALQVKDFKEKMKQTNLARHGVAAYAQNPNWKEEYKESLTLKNNILLHDGKTVKEVSEILGKASSTLYAQIKKYGFDIARNITKQMSSLEKIIKSILDELGVIYETQKELVGKTKEKKMIYDFFLPKYKLFIEADGIFWHSDYKKSDIFYHKIKRQIALENDCEILFFRENEILNNIIFVKSYITFFLNNVENKENYTVVTDQNNPIYAKYFPTHREDLMHIFVKNENIYGKISYSVSKEKKLIEVNNFVAYNNVNILNLLLSEVSKQFHNYEILIDFDLKLEKPERYSTILKEKKVDYIDYKLVTLKNNKVYEKREEDFLNKNKIKFQKIWDAGHEYWFFHEK